MPLFVNSEYSVTFNRPSKEPIFFKKFKSNENIMSLKRELGELELEYLFISRFIFGKA